MPELTTVPTSDGETLEAELTRPDGRARAVVVLCHPHPQYGGSMRSLVISELFRTLRDAGVAALRFNFRGVEASSGTWDHGAGERLDVAAALERASSIDAGAPLVLAGWSFGADMALATSDPRVAGWFAIAAPLRYTTDADLETLAADPRPKLLALAAHDEVRPPEEVAAAARTWAATEVVVVPGASHFFVGRTDQLVTLARTFVGRVAPSA